MLIAYASKTGNIKRFVNKLNYDNCLEIKSGNENINEDLLLITYTTGIGEIPTEVSSFLQNNHERIKYVVGSGNKNWGTNFCNATNLISQKYNIPILMKFELSGTEKDTTKLKTIIKEKINEYNHYTTTRD